VINNIILLIAFTTIQNTEYKVGITNEM